MRDPDSARSAKDYPAPNRPIILVRKMGNGRFRYLYLYRGDSEYAAVKRAIAAGEGVGGWRADYTKRIYLPLQGVRKIWPACPL